MHTSLTQGIRRDALRSLEDLAGRLQKRAEQLSGEAQDAVRHAATDVSEAAEDLRVSAVRGAKLVTRDAARNVRAHPVAAAAGAMALLAGLAGLFAAARRRQA